MGNWADARAPSCFKVRKSSRTARSRRHGLSFPDRGQESFPGCAVRAGLKATLEKGLTQRWITGSNDIAIVPSPLRLRRERSTKREDDRAHLEGFTNDWVVLSWREDIDPAEIQRRGNALLKT